MKLFVNLIQKKFFFCFYLFDLNKQSSPGCGKCGSLSSSFNGYANLQKNFVEMKQKIILTLSLQN